MEKKFGKRIDSHKVKNKVFKIVITGPESTGKSTLTQSLANYFKEPYVYEMARNYLTDLKRPYAYDDLKEIAILQLEEEEKKIQDARDYLFIDTDLVVLKIWSNFKFKKCDPFILENLLKRSYNYYLLCDTDLAWEADPLREAPDLKTREELFEINKSELKFYNKIYGVVSGDQQKRVEMAIDLVSAQFAF